MTDPLIGSLLRAVIFTALGVEGVLALVLLPRFLTLGLDLRHAAWYAVFMSASIFNNAGFVIMPEGLAPHAADWWMCLPIVLGTFAGLLRDSGCCSGDLRSQGIKEPAVGNVRFGLLDHDLYLTAWGNFALRTCRLKGLNKTVDSARNVR